MKYSDEQNLKSIDKTIKKPEILAPCGSMEAFYAALNNGADAVYLGGKFFGARAYANNFEIDELKQMVEEAHLRNVRVYYTLNTLIKDVEMKQLHDQLNLLRTVAFDGFIIQDMGVYQVIKKYYADLTIHSSTQMNLHNLDSVKLMKQLGFERVVLAREVSLKDIKVIRKSVDIEIETFVHGALCYSFSGQCLMSSIYGGRSGNRGKCAQPCRLPYTHNGTKAYMLSPKDQMTLDLMPEFIDASIDSFKIEGRMKSAEYVGFTSALYSYYRDYAIDLIEKGQEKNYKVEPEDIKTLKEIYNRGEFTTGYYKRHNHRQMISYSHGKHYGVLVGEGTVQGKGFEIQLSDFVSKGDLLELQGRHQLVNDESCLTFYADRDLTKGRHYLKVIYDDKQRKRNSSSYGVQSFIVRRLKNERIQLDKAVNLLESVPVLGELHCRIGENLQLNIMTTDQKVQVSVEGEQVQEAKSKGTEVQAIDKKLNKTGDTSMVFEQITYEMDEGVFVPLSQINRLRRDGIEKLKVAILEQYTKQRDKVPHRLSDLLNETYCEEIKTDLKHNKIRGDLERSSYSVLVRNQDQSKVVNRLIQKKVGFTNRIERIYIDVTDLTSGMVNQILNDLSRLKLDLVIGLPNVVLDPSTKALKDKIQALTLEQVNGFLIRDLGQIQWLNELGVLSHKFVVNDYSTNVFNTKALSFYDNCGFVNSHLSLELNKQGISTILKAYPSQAEYMVYGRVPVMQTANCIIKTMEGCNPSIVSQRTVIKDRKDEWLPVSTHCEMCYNTIYNSKITYLLDETDNMSGLKRIELYDESMETIEALFTGQLQFNADSMTRGHFKRGVK